MKRQIRRITPTCWMASLSWAMAHLLGLSTSHAAEDARAAFISEYKSAYPKVIENYTNVDSTYVVRHGEGNEVIQVTSATARFKLGHYRSNSEIQFVNTKTKAILRSLPTTIEVGNSQYEFQLRKSKDGEYVIHKLDILPASVSTGFLPVTAPYGDDLLRKTFMDMAEDPEVLFVTFGDARFNGQNTRELKVEIPAVDAATKNKVKRKRTYFFLPERHWLCCGKQADLDGAGQTQYVEETYEYDSGAYPALKAIRSVLKNRNDPKAIRPLMSLEVSGFTRAPSFPNEDFRLSAFGLPEPPGIDWKRPTPWYLWIAAVAVACLLLAGVLAWLRRNKSRTQAI